MGESFPEYKKLHRSLVEVTSLGRIVTARETLLWDAFAGGWGDYGTEVGRTVSPDTIVGMRKEFTVNLSSTNIDIQVNSFNESAGMTSKDNMWRKDNGAVLIGHVRFSAPRNDNETPEMWGSFLLWTDGEVECSLEYGPVEEATVQYGEDVFQFLEALSYPEDILSQAKSGEGVSDDLILEPSDIDRFTSTLRALLGTTSQS